MKKITVLLADDHTVVREGLRALLEIKGEFKVVGEASNGLQAVELSRNLCPDVVVMDIAMPQLNGLEAARRILQQVSPRPSKVLILSAHADDAYIEQVAAMGVQGYLIKQSSFNVLAKAIKEIHNGNVFYSHFISKRLRQSQEEPGQTRRFSRAGHKRKIDILLTPRESEVLQLIAEGRANKKIAADLGISIKTVEKHRQSVMQKLDIHNTSGLTRYAISAGIIESSVHCTIIP